MEKADARGGWKVGVLLVNTGSPAAPESEAVRRYLAAFLMDPCVRPLPAPIWWAILHLFVLPARKHASARKYRLIWEEDGSPLLSRCERLARRVEDELKRRHSKMDAPVVRAAMSYGEPSCASALVELREAGCACLVVVPLYPQSAMSTTKAALRGVHRSLARLGWAPDLVEVSEYASRSRYLDAVAESIADAGFDPSRDFVLFSFHSVPLANIEKGDTYVEQVRATCDGVAERLGLAAGAWDLAFQSPFEDNRTWQGPFTADVIAHRAQIAQRTFVVCPGFSVDCLETLYDVEHEFRACFQATAMPGAELIYVPCLNDGAAQVELLASVVEEQGMARA
ncbi:ferrochelatase [Collinsella sp. An2]|uniref:ferrochelatase n=1 Tax=Collinsella sp. An2 TaxID=1965585 RepID=UPI000B36652B|nr:ferrochelatase [Collinsella sp. An2]OUP08910.1 ferrochelatase [Collinsella sp. An2]